MNAETTAEDIEKLLDEVTKRCNSRIAAESSSIGSGLGPQWVEYKERATSLMQDMNGFPKSITDEISAESRNLFLPVLKKALEGVGSLHWIGVGFSFIAWVLDMIETSAPNREDLIRLLLRIVCLLKSTKKIWQTSSTDYLEDLQSHVEKALRCAVICSSIIEHCYLYRFLNSTSFSDSIAKLSKDVDSAFEELSPQYEGGPRIQLQPTLAHSDGTDREDGVKEEAMNYLRKVCGKLVVAVCLQGMGGIGKSTIGETIFVNFQEIKNAQGKQKYRCCRVELQQDIEDRDLQNILKTIMDKLCHHSTPELSEVGDWRVLLEDELKIIRDPVFLYLDNVLKKSHLCKLLPKSTIFPEGSKILVTTRDEDVSTGMEDLKVDDYKLIRVKKLDDTPAMNLLQKQLERSKLGLPNDAEWEAIEPLVKELLSLCDGLPLALKAMGRYIANTKPGPKYQNVWKRAIDGMRKAESLHGDDVAKLYQRLEFSIDNLDQETKGAFLDVVAFAVGGLWEDAECLVGADRLEELRERALVKERSSRLVDGYLVKTVVSVVGVHDVLKAIGIRMVADDVKEIRVISEDGLSAIATSPGNVVGLMNVTVEAKLLQNMPNLRVLKKVQMEGKCEAAAKKLRHLSALDIECHTSSPFDWCTCEALRLLRWKSKATDSKITLEELARLTCLTSLHLSLRECLSLPAGVANLTGLKTLNLSGCKFLKLLPEGIANLTGLKTLNLSKCKALKLLPDGVANLTALTSLNLTSCERLKSLPDGVASLTGLISLDLRSCKRLELLPEGVARLTGLTSFDLHCCERLKSLPDGVASLTGLETLDMSGCKSLELLPEGVASLTGVTSLDLSMCEALESLPEGVASLAGLMNLNLSRCEGLESLLEGVARLTGLEILNLTGCEGLESLPDGVNSLTALRSLNLLGCKGLKSLPEGVARFTGLRRLDLTHCERLKSLPEGVASLTGLETLDLSGCKRLKSLPEGVASLTGLTNLDLRSCKRLKSLPEGVGSFTGMTSLGLSYCKRLESLPEGVASWTGLTNLNLCGCEGLKSLPEGVASLTGLTSLYFFGCESLESLPEGVASLTGLENVELSGCKGLKVLPEGVASWTGLTNLDLSRCEGLESLPEGVASWTGLENIELSGCKGLKSLLEEVASWTGLFNLDLSSCEGLKSLPEGVSSLTGLESLDLSDCKGLESLSEGLASMIGLASLHLCGCKRLKSLPEGIASLTGLTNLNLYGCEGLQSLPEGVASLTGLKTLDLSGCKGLESLPEGVGSLTGLSISGWSGVAAGRNWKQLL